MPLLEGIAEDTTVYADKGYDSAENRQHLKEHQLLDGIMRKAHRNRPLTEVQTKRNRYLSKTRYVEICEIGYRDFGFDVNILHNAVRS